MRSEDDALLDALTALASVVGMDVPPDAVDDDEHGRWPLYDEALRRPEANPVLLRLVGLEPNEGIAVSIVLQMVEAVDEAEQDRWVWALPADRRGFARWRAREVGIARRVAGEGVGPDELDVEQWSDWLQRRVARDGGQLAVLDALAVDGRSRRVRAQAAEHARRARKRLSS